jgi:hypothetical protein
MQRQQNRNKHDVRRPKEIRKRGPTRMSVSEESTLHKIPAKCKEKQLHQWRDSYVKFTYIDEKLDQHIDTYFVETCKICREIKQ